MAKFITFGEIMMRLTPPGREKILQTPQFVATFGGAEANVAVALSNYGEDAAFVTALPSTTGSPHPTTPSSVTTFKKSHRGGTLKRSRLTMRLIRGLLY
jgi:hypothetical protein